MLEKQVLRDDNLEALNIIKEIDTLSIINKAEEIMKKREAKKINLIGITICMLLLIFNVTTGVVCGVKTFFILQISFLWLSPILIFPVIKKYFFREELK